MSIAIVTDSTADLTDEIIGARPITVVPCYTNVDGRSCLDGIELTRAEFYRQLPFYRVAPTTSAPNAEAFATLFSRLVAQGVASIVCICVPDSLSNTCNAARMAARNVPEASVTVLDSGQLSLGIGHIVLAAGDAALAGAGVSEIIALAQAMRRRSFSFGVVATLEYLQRSGRLSWAQASLGSLLRIKPLLHIHEGVIEVEKPRTMSKAIERMLTLVSGLGALERISLIHTHAGQTQLDEMRRLIGPFLPARIAPLTVEATPALGVHLGPGVVALCCVQEADLPWPANKSA